MSRNLFIFRQGRTLVLILGERKIIFSKYTYPKVRPVKFLKIMNIFLSEKNVYIPNALTIANIIRPLEKDDSFKNKKFIA